MCSRFRTTVLIVFTFMLYAHALSAVAGTDEKSKTSKRLVHAIAADDTKAVETILAQDNDVIDRKFHQMMVNVCLEGNYCSWVIITPFPGSDLDWRIKEILLSKKDIGEVVRLEAFTPLLFALKMHSFAVAELLMKRGANVNFMDYSQRGYLVEMLDDFNVKGFQLLISHPKINVNLISKGSGWHPLARAILCRNRGAVKELLNKGADPNVPIPSSQPYGPEDARDYPIHILCKGIMHVRAQAEAEADLEILRVLVQAGAKLNVSDRQRVEQNYPLECARKSAKHLVQELEKSGASASGSVDQPPYAE